MRNIFHNDQLQVEFEKEGYVLIDFLGAREIEQLVALHGSVDGDLGNAPYVFTAMSRDFTYRKRISDGIKDIFRPKIRKILRECRPIMGNFFFKPASNDKNESEIYIHQDWSFVDEARHHSLTIWCPLTDVNEDNGCLAVVPGSHKLNNRPRGLAYTFPYPKLESLLKEKYSVHLTVKAGQAVMFAQSLFHWSKPNRRNTARLAASCFVAPNECSLVYPHPDAHRHPDKLELFAVDEDFFPHFNLGERPANVPSLGLIDSKVEPLSEEILEQKLGNLRKC